MPPTFSATPPAPLAETAGATRPDLMVVDDTPANLALVELILRGQGYRVRCFPRGDMALAAAATQPPDLILLDIGMPGMDGYEVCRRLKASPPLAAVPVVFLSALHETDNKVRGLQCGGVDYVTKPFQAEELLARVRVHLELSRLRARLQVQNARLDEEVRRRTADLAAAHARLALLDRAKTEFLQLIAHELRTPLNGLLGVSELLIQSSPPDPEHASLRELFSYSRDRLLNTLDDALLFAQIEADADRFKSGTQPLGRLLAEAAAQVAEFARVRGLSPVEVPGTEITVRGDPELCVKALRSLLETALRFAADGSALAIAVSIGDAEAVVTIEARGHGIPDRARPRFFEVLAIPEAIVPGGDLGLAAPLAQRILALFDATVGVESLVPPGIRLSVRFRMPETVPTSTPAPHP